MIADTKARRKRSEGSKGIQLFAPIQKAPNTTGFFPPTGEGHGPKSWESGVSHGKRWDRVTGVVFRLWSFRQVTATRSPPNKIYGPSINCCRTCRGRDDSWVFLNS